MSNDNFLFDYLALNEGTEIPDIFALWCGISGISAVLGRRCFIDMGTYTVFPNLYIVLVAGSGRCRKSTAIGIIERLLRELEPPVNLIAQRLSPEGLIDAMRQGMKEAEGKSKPLCEGVVIVDELSTFLTKRNYEIGLGALLTTLFDCKDVFEYRTRGHGIEDIHNSCLNLLGGSTVDWIRASLPEEAIGGGLTSRIIFVYASKPPAPVARTTFSKAKHQIVQRLHNQLQRLRIVCGEFRLTPDAWKFYEQEYINFYNRSPFYDERTLAGYASRRHVHMLKLGMVFACAGESDNLIDVNHLEGAVKVLENTEAQMPMVIALITANETGTLVESVFRSVSRTGRISKPQLISRMSHKLTARELEVVVETLTGAGKIRTEVEGNKIYYVLGG